MFWWFIFNFAWSFLNLSKIKDSVEDSNTVSPPKNLAPKKKASSSSQAAAARKKTKNLIKLEQKANPDYGQSINPISRLIQIQQAKKQKEPVYTLIAERGMPRRREFVMQVSQFFFDIYKVHLNCPFGVIVSTHSFMVSALSSL